MLSCGRVKTELFENADVTVSIYDVAQHALGSLGITRGHFACPFSFIEVRKWNFVIEYRIVNITAFTCGRGSFFKRIRKDAFSKISGYVRTGPKSSLCLDKDWPSQDCTRASNHMKFHVKLPCVAKLLSLHGHNTFKISVMNVGCIHFIPLPAEWVICLLTLTPSIFFAKFHFCF